MAAALYVAPGAVLRVVAGAPVWPWVVLVAVLVTLVGYALSTGRPFALLALVVVLGVCEALASFGAALGNVCGTSRLATDLKVGGTAAILLVAGTWCIRRQRLWLTPLALVAAPLWIVLVSYVIPGGSGSCFE